jgi:ComF family protein
MPAWLDSALDLIYPRACAGCRMALEGGRGHLCWDCRSDVRPIVPPYCARCGNPVEGRIDHRYICYHCTQAAPHFTLARCAARFEGVLPRLVHAFKYREALWLAGDLAELLEACWETHYAGRACDAVAAVPLHPARRRARGYNQAALLAGALARRIGRPLLAGCLHRVRDTQTQTHLTARERLHNVTDAFEAARPARLRGRKVLLVDDVMTTGATVGACAKALTDGGAAEVLVLTLARGG